MPFFKFKAGDVRNGHQPGIVKGDINAAIGFVQRRHACRYGGLVCHIHFQRDGFTASSLNFADQSLQAIQAARGEANFNAMCG